MAEPVKDAAASPPAGEGSRFRRLMGWVAEEFKQLAFVFLYLYVCFGIFNLHERMVLAQHEITFSIVGLSVINALVFAKVMIVAEHLHFARRFHNHPLVLPILYKALAFALLFIAFHILENVIIGVVAGRTFVDSIPPVGGGGVTGIVVVGVIMGVMLMPYFAYRELSRVIGEHVLHAALFRRRQHDAKSDAEKRPPEDATKSSEMAQR